MSLAILKEYNAKATFFCIGENIAQNPELFNKLHKEGHAVGNHTYNHLNGWKTSTREYIENSVQCSVLSDPLENKKIFRPPYGKIKPSQAKKLRQLGYKIIMWDVLSADFDTSISVENCYLNVINNAKPGSIIVFHDSVKSFPVLQQVIPKILEYYSKKGFEFKALPTEFL